MERLRNSTGARPVALRLGVVLVFVLPLRLALAGSMDDFYKLEEQMADAQEAYMDAVGAKNSKEGVNPDQAAAVAQDPRPAILKKMDALAVASLGKDEGAEMAIGVFNWSWNLDLDLPALLHRFERIVHHYPNDPRLQDVLPTAWEAGLSSDRPQAWADALSQLSRATGDKKIKVTAWIAIGQLNLGVKKLREAKAAFQNVLKLKPEKELVDVAKGYIYEIEHLQVGMAAPNFVGRSIEGKEVSLESLRGQVVLLNFWASW